MAAFGVRLTEHRLSVEPFQHKGDDLSSNTARAGRPLTLQAVLELRRAKLCLVNSFRV